MSFELQPPFQTSFDPRDEAEGSIDPLGTQRVYEVLAERLLPFVTVRMARPRFLTAIVVGIHVVSTLTEQFTRDGRTPAWLAFEWHVVEAFHRCRDQLSEKNTGRIPGWSKVKDTLDRGHKVSHATYLKTATIFGYTGVYRRLANGLQLVTDDMHLDEGGFELLRIWEHEQRLPGFVSGSAGSGAELRDSMRRAVGHALERGYADRPRHWQRWAQLTKHLAVASAGHKEARYLLDRLSDPGLRQNEEDPEALHMRQELLRCLKSRGRSVGNRQEEAKFFRGLKGKVSRGLRYRLNLVDSYEALCRPLEDAFRLATFLSTEKNSGLISPKDFSSEPEAAVLYGRVERGIRRVEKAFASERLEPELQRTLSRFSSVPNARTLFTRLLDHHEEVQRSKPPDGKRPWVARQNDGIMVRPAFAQPERPLCDTAYVHDYRTASLSSFLRDLGWLRR